MYLIYYKENGQRTWIKSEDHNLKKALHNLYIEPNVDKNEICYIRINQIWEQYTE